jgi:glyoxylase-like metal-dependent hydrolase (beta-lactamase superfamily II)/rhodanese-related sulfurtransferase
MNGKDNRVILVDPVITIASDYIHHLEENGWVLTHVIDTHTHADHISAGPLLKAATGCEYIMHQDAPAECVTIRVKNGDVLNLNGNEIKILYTPGHTKDSISLVLDNKILTGDVLFLDDGGAGRDDLPGGNTAEHWESLEVLKKQPDDLMVYPAHDYGDRQSSTLGKQRQSNPHLKKRIKNEFIEYIEDLRLGPEEWMKDVLKANYQCTTDPKAAWIPENNKACEIKGVTDEAVETEAIKYIEVDALKNKIRSDNNKPVLLDVREKKELTEGLGHLEGIINIPIGSLSNRINELEKYKDNNIVVICRSGARAAAGARILRKEGFMKVFVLKGGMINWRKNEK